MLQSPKFCYLENFISVHASDQTQVILGTNPWETWEWNNWILKVNEVSRKISKVKEEPKHAHWEKKIGGLINSEITNYNQYAPEIWS